MPRELKYAAVRKVRPGERTPPAPNELEPILYHLQQALEMMRMLPLGTLTREQFYTWIYHHVCVANNLIIEDMHYPGTVEPGPDENQLLSDLKDITG